MSGGEPVHTMAETNVPTDMVLIKKSLLPLRVECIRVLARIAGVEHLDVARQVVCEEKEEEWVLVLEPESTSGSAVSDTAS